MYLTSEMMMGAVVKRRFGSAGHASARLMFERL